MTVLREPVKMQSERTAAKSERRLFYLRMPKYSDRAIYYSMLVLSVFGLLMIASASMGLTVGKPNRLALIVVKQLVFLVGGYLMMTWLANSFTLDFLKSASFPTWPLGVMAALLSCLAFAPVGGARAWIRLPISTVDVSIQPSEFAKIMVILIVAAYCGEVKKTYPNQVEMVKRPLMFIGAYIFIVMVLQSDLGSAVVIGFISVFCLLIPSHPQMRGLQRLIVAGLLLGVALTLFVLSPYGEIVIRHLPLREYQINRILSSIDPFVDMYNTGYQLISGLVSFATGGWTGLGFGNSVRKYTNFPAANTDFILAIVVEELGMIGFGLIFIPYMIIIIQLFRYALKIQNEKGKIILVGTAMYLVVHCLFNIGGVTGLIPLTGVPLLMISSGGSSTLAFMAAIGLGQAVIDQYRRGAIQ
ncbi:MAG: FtsW/RodA/SpoVE family cell cycle protein [Solobacterium sp.]|nr:FtsW/RodA/SpoVE family cell cycle protein [Solobacterium sp.]